MTQNQLNNEAALMRNKENTFIPQKVLDDRAQFYAQPKSDADRGLWEDEEYLLFKLGSESYVVGLNELDEISPVGSGSILPHTDGRICGLMNLRAEVLLLVNTAQVMGIAEESNNEQVSTDKKILIFKDDKNQRTGFLIDGIERALVFEEGLFKAVEDRSKYQFVSAIGDINGKNINQLNVAGLLAEVDNIV